MLGSNPGEHNTFTGLFQKASLCNGGLSLKTHQQKREANPKVQRIMSRMCGVEISHRPVVNKKRSPYTALAFQATEKNVNLILIM